MTILHVSLKDLSGDEDLYEPTPRSSVWLWPYTGYPDGTSLVTTAIVKTPLVDGDADVPVPPTPIGNALWVQLRGVRGGPNSIGVPFLIAVQSSGTQNLSTSTHLDKATLDPTTPPSPAWLSALEAVDTKADDAQADATTAQSTADAAVSGLGSKVDTSTYNAGIGAINTELTGRLSDAALDDTIASGVVTEGRTIFTGKTTLTPGRSGEELAPNFVDYPHDLITHSSLGMPTIQTMRVLCTDGIISSPLGRFYANLCTDHDNTSTPEPWHGKGGVVLAYADSPLGPWTAYRDGGGNLIIYQDTVVGNQTETPTPLYVPDDPAGKPIYCYYQNQGVGLNQSTLLARSATGLPNDFERVGIVVQGRGTVNPVWPGDGQSTYLEPFRLNGQIVAVHLMGGGDWAQYGRSYSPDGRNFVTDPRRFGHFSHLVGADNGRRVSIRSVFQWRGSPWAVVTIGNHTSGFVTAPRQVGFVRLSQDLRRVVGRVHTLADSAIGAGGVLEHDGKLYLFYRSGDAYSAFRCAIAEA